MQTFPYTNAVDFRRKELDAARWFFSKRQNKNTYRMVDHARRSLRRAERLAAATVEKCMESVK